MKTRLTNLLVLSAILLLAVVAAGQAAQPKGSDIAEAVAAIRAERPSPAQKKVVDMVLAAMLQEHYKKQGLSGQQITPLLTERLNQTSRLTLMTVAVMTANNPGAARQFTLDDLMGISGVVMGKMKDLKVTDDKLKDQSFIIGKFIPEVIEALAK